MAVGRERFGAPMNDICTVCLRHKILDREKNDAPQGVAERRRSKKGSGVLNKVVVNKIHLKSAVEAQQLRYIGVTFFNRVHERGFPGRVCKSDVRPPIQQRLHIPIFPVG
jgi:hypothetical protein